MMVTEELVREALKEVYDPELNYNIIDLGLIYNIEVGEDGVVHLLMTLTSPGCPVGPAIVEQINESVMILPGVKDTHVELTFDPLWNPDKMSEEAKADLGID
ncbi:MAG: metal-sulfur cluster assembly factor [Dehalococcoidia bacterium]